MRTFRHSLPLFEEKKDPPGGGSEPPPVFTEDQTKAMGAIVNAAVTSQLKRTLGPALTDAIGGLKLSETIAAEVAKLKPETPEPKHSDKPDPKVSALEATVQELKQKLAADAEERKKLVEASRDKDGLAALKSALAPLVRPEALEIAARDLFVAQKRVSFDEQGNPLITVRKAAFAGGTEEDVQMPLSDGVQHWIKTPEGKFFAPAPSGGAQDPRGNGAPRRVNTGLDGMPRYEGPATTDAEKIRRAGEREAALKQRFPELK
jgi:hypothetical protein